MAANHLAALALALTVSSAPASAVVQDPAAEPGVTPPTPQQPQVGPPAPQAFDDKSLSAIEAFLGEGVVAVVGRELIRRNDVVAAFESEDYDKQIEGLAVARRSTDPKVRERGHLLVLVEMLRDHLKAEGGRNQGYAQEMIDAILAQRMTELQRKVGGAVAASETLRQYGFDPASYNTRNEALLLRQTWQRSVTGLAPGPTGRASVDRFVAPGLMQLEYRNRLESPDAEVRSTLGEEPQRYVLEQVILGLIDYRGPEPARAVAEGIQAEVRAGKLTMEAAARQFTLPQNRITEWQIDPLSEAQVQALSRGRYDGTQLAEWVLSASPGDVSEPFMLKLVDNGVLKPAALVVFRLAEVLASRGAAPFGETAVQARLGTEIQKAWDDARTERTLVDLLEATYVLPLDLRSNLLRGARRGANPAADGQGLR